VHILHVLSQTHLTGAEVHAATLCALELAQGDLPILVSDTITVPLPDGADYVPMPIHDRGYLNRLRNVRRLVRLCRERQVDVIHAHSRAASWVANLAARRARVGYVSTIHGRQHLHPSSRTWNIYGRHIIAICDDLAEHLEADLGIPAALIRVIPNAAT
jgi:hypothetical protein